MSWADQGRRQHISRFVGDLAKAIFAVGLASQLFKGSPLYLRIVLAATFVLFVASSILGYPKGKEDKS
ncbi:MAG: hypothetical protein HYZ94_01935 [Candidatus Omnitrophica bacterium]|nr:hypothetical protein [Candidatus Omnitrophota bacterium]